MDAAFSWFVHTICNSQLTFSHLSHFKQLTYGSWSNFGPGSKNTAIPNTSGEAKKVKKAIYATWILIFTRCIFFIWSLQTRNSSESLCCGEERTKWTPTINPPWGASTKKGHVTWGQWLHVLKKKSANVVRMFCSFFKNENCMKHWGRALYVLWTIPLCSPRMVQ